MFLIAKPILEYLKDATFITLVFQLDSKLFILLIFIYSISFVFVLFIINVFVLFT